MSFIELLGQQAAAQGAGGVISEGMGLLTQGIKNKQQARQQKRLTNIQLDAQKHMGDFNFKKQMELWEKTGYGAQVKQMQEAGLNPAMIYGMGGAGGQSTSINAGTAGGGTAGLATGAHGEGMGMMPLVKAQVDNINMDTYKKKVEADKLAGVDTDKTKAETQSLLQGITNQKTQNELMQIQDSILRNELFEKYSTQDWRFSLYAEQAKEQIAKAKSAMVEANINEATQNDKIKQLKAEAIGQLLKNALTNSERLNVDQDTKLKISQIKVNDEMIKKWANEIMIAWDRLAQGNREIGNKEFTEILNVNEELPIQIMPILGGPMRSILQPTPNKVGYK